MDYYQKFQARCLDNATKIVDKERVFDFLARFNVEFDQIRIEVLGQDSFPTLKQTY